MSERVQKDMDEGIKSGISSTPTIYINGRSVVGSQAFSAYKNIIDSELRKL